MHETFMPEDHDSLLEGARQGCGTVLSKDEESDRPVSALLSVALSNSFNLV